MESPTKQWRGGDYRGGHRPQGGGSGLHRRVVPDKGESVSSLIHSLVTNAPPGGPVPPILPPQDGFLLLDKGARFSTT